MEPVHWADALLGATLIEVGVRIGWAVLGSGLTVLGFWGLRRRVKALEAKASAAGPTINVNIGNEAQRASHSPPINGSGHISAKAEEQVGQQQSNIIPPQKTPKELVKMVEGLTTVQANKAMAPYIDTTLSVRAIVTDVDDKSDHVEVTGRFEDNTKFYFEFSGPSWKSAAERLSRGEEIEVTGTLSHIANWGITLEQCELQ